MLSVLMFKLKKGTLYGKLLKGHEEKAVEEGSDATGGSGSSSEQPASSEEGAKDVALTFPEEASGSAVAPSGALAAEPQHPQGNVASAVTRTLAGIGRHAACARGWFARQESQRAVVEGAVWLSLFGLVVGLLCASLLPGIDLSVTEWEEGLPGSAPFPSLGVTRKFTLVIQEVEVALPGGGVRRLVTANGTFPGPELRAQHGNWVEVRIINNMSTHNTSMHWHGIVHRSSQFADGVVGITQCAIPARGEAETSEVIYRFECYHSGTFWYHGHFEGQYVDGLIGPLIVEGIPETHGRLYNAEWTWMAADWCVAGPPTQSVAEVGGVASCAGLPCCCNAVHAGAPVCWRQSGDMHNRRMTRSDSHSGALLSPVPPRLAGTMGRRTTSSRTSSSAWGTQTGARGNLLSCFLICLCRAAPGCPHPRHLVHAASE